MLKVNRNKIGHITITLDGSKDTHNSRRINKNGEESFDTIISNIEALVINGVNVVIQVNIDQDNIDCVEKLFLFIENNSVLSSCTVLLNRVLHTTNGISELELLRLYVRCSRKVSFNIMINSVTVKALTNIISGDESIAIGRCNAGNIMVFDFSSGYIYTCPESSKTRCGSFTNEGIIVNQAYLDEVVRYTKKDMPLCKSCEYNLYCGKGCYIEQDLSLQNCKGEIQDILQYIFDNFETFFDIEC